MVLSKSSKNSLTLPQTIASAGLAGCTADLLTFPLDTVKVWLQVRGEGTTSLSGNNQSRKISRNSNLRFKKANNSSSLTSFKEGNTMANMRGQTMVTKSTFQDRPSNTNRSVSSNQFAYSTNNTAISRVKHVVTDVNTPAKQVKPGATQILSGKNWSAFSTNAPRPKNFGLLKTIMHGVRSNGFLSLYGGISAGLQRQMAFCAVRIGLYDRVKSFYYNLLPGNHSGGKHLGQRMLAGTTTALIAVGLFQPTEVVKIRMQAQTTKTAESRLYSSSFQAYKSLFQVGMGEAWKGVGTNAARLAVVNVCELVTYDVFKELLLDHKLMTDNPACHFTSAFLSGFVTTVIASPIDVIKTRYMNSKKGHYKSPLECAKRMFSNEGFRAFYKGFVPAYLRLGTWNIAMFVSYEQYKVLFNRYNQRQLKSIQKSSWL